uniref:Chromo domain-containing protein n=1 Tax=Bionectria ochroleuca TaxID=29856 RepID=A0A8H7N3R6_BIOOC
MVSTPDDVEMLDADLADDDNLSLTSTITDEINSDEEWTAEGIIAEGRMNGVKHWLVEWTGYPLAEATWEPRTHVQGQLLRTWRKRKARQERGEEGRFDLNIWRNALSEQLRAKYARHEKRNEKRLHMGLAPTTWEQPVDELLKLT